jgi:hypothetical protein
VKLKYQPLFPSLTYSFPPGEVGVIRRDVAPVVPIPTCPTRFPKVLSRHVGKIAGKRMSHFIDPTSNLECTHPLTSWGVDCRLCVVPSRGAADINIGRIDYKHVEWHKNETCWFLLVRKNDQIFHSTDSVQWLKKWWKQIGGHFPCFCLKLEGALPMLMFLAYACAGPIPATSSPAPPIDSSPPFHTKFFAGKIQDRRGGVARRCPVGCLCGFLSSIAPPRGDSTLRTVLRRLGKP